MPRNVRTRQLMYKNKAYNTLQLPKECRDVIFSFLDFMTLRKCKCTCKIQRAGRSESFALDAAEATAELLKTHNIMHIYVSQVSDASHTVRVLKDSVAHTHRPIYPSCHHIVLAPKSEKRVRWSIIERVKHQRHTRGMMCPCPLNVSYPGQETNIRAEWDVLRCRKEWTDNARDLISPMSREKGCCVCAKENHLGDIFVMSTTALRQFRDRMRDWWFYTRVSDEFSFRRLKSVGAPKTIVELFFRNGSFDNQQMLEFMRLLRFYNRVLVCRSCLYYKTDSPSLYDLYMEELETATTDTKCMGLMVCTPLPEFVEFAKEVPSYGELTSAVAQINACSF